MPNSIALAEKYLPILDEIYKANSKSAILDVPANRIMWTGAKTCKVFKISLDGLGDYDRNGGYVAGYETSTWEPLELEQDRGRYFQIDRMDNEETLGMAFGSLAGELIRTKVVPEVDAYTFAKLAGSAGTTVSATLTSATAEAAVNVAETSQFEDEVPEEGKILFCSATVYKGLADGVDRLVENDERNIQHQVDFYNGMRVVKVPANRFYSAIDLLDGSSTGEEAGGYAAATGAKALNFLMVHPSAVIKIVKHALPRIFSPDINQDADAWKFDYRMYHDVFVLANKVKGVYCHKAA